MILREPHLTARIDELSEELRELVDPLDNDQLRELTVHAIQEHRRLLELAENAFREWDTAKQQAAPDQEERQDAYVRAMKNNQAQTMLVAALTDRLGYVPLLEKDGPSDKE